MDIDAYAEWASSTAPAPTEAEATGTHLAELGLGLVGDAGEVADLIKKCLRDGVLDREHLAHELGDVLYYWARLCAVTSLRPSELLERSRRSIEARLANRAGRA
jgi:NTP pyrophosphatase (non-canonical NTP hydrolase)